MELTALALRTAAQKLRPYFQAHPVIVLSDQPLRNILHKPDLTGRMLQWAIELSEFGIEYQPRLSKKGQVMADFVLEYSRKPNQHHEASKQEWWTLQVDGASRSSGSGVGLVLQSPTGEHLEQAIRLGFSASNNEAEYEAILSGLDLALALSVSKIRIYSDSQLVVRHVQKEYEAKDARMVRYLAKVRSTLQQFTEWTIEKLSEPTMGATLGIAPPYPSKKPFYCLIPTEIGLPTIRTDAAKQDDSNIELGRNLDWADEVRESAAIRMADYQQRASAHYNRKVRPRNFKNGTLVLRKVFENTAEIGAGKFQANWEGPYIVSKANENGAYRLQKLDGTPLLRPWNVSNLKQYYQ
ncbi:hypothetical protein AAG906_031790 [Vitis piasezkii]